MADHPRRSPFDTDAATHGRVRHVLIVSALGAALVAAASSSVRAQNAPPIPLVTGLTIVSALH